MGDRISERLALVPHRPGVYQMLDQFNHVIYIGKAKDLFNRLSSYFKTAKHDQKTAAMLSHVVDFQYFVTPTENDALALESNLIKRFKPHYNILLKDSKSFPYIVIEGGKVAVTHKVGAPARGKEFFGPYFNGIRASGLLDTVYDIFGVRGQADPETVRKIRAFLQGERDFNARQILTDKMNQAASMQQYELAIRYRNGISFLDKLAERTIADVGRNVNADVFAAASGAIFVVSVLTVRAGRLIGVQNFANHNDSPLTDDEKLEEFIEQYYLENVRPKEVIKPALATPPLKGASIGVEVRTSCDQGALSGKSADGDDPDASPLPGGVAKGRMASKYWVQRHAGFKKKLLAMAEENAREYLATNIEQITHKTAFTEGACVELGEALNLPRTPKKIECFDISHLGGESVVASMVVFIDGVAERKLYRKFFLKNQQNNDFQNMAEVISRRLARLNQGAPGPSIGNSSHQGGPNGDPSFGPAPDLILVDGGKGQLSAAEAVCPESLGISLAALAKENEELFVPGNPDPIILSKHSYARRLAQRIRDEAHRFAIGYNKALRQKNMK